jgi:hypothetical protein
MVRLGSPGVQVSIGEQKDLADRSDAIGGFLKLHELVASQEPTCREIGRITRLDLINGLKPAVPVNRLVQRDNDLG